MLVPDGWAGGIKPPNGGVKVRHSSCETVLRACTHNPLVHQPTLLLLPEPSREPLVCLEPRSVTGAGPFDLKRG